MQVRAVNKARNRQTLLESTANIIAEAGIEGASISAICERAALSRGMVHLHFANKDALLLEVVRYLNEQYFEVVDTALGQAPESPVEQILAVVKADLSEQLLNRRNVNLWYAFRGLARSRTDVLQYSDTRDNALREHLMRCYQALAPKKNGSRQRARDATHGTLALLEGLWADYYLHDDRFNRRSAVRIVCRFIGGLYPNIATSLGLSD